jgi:mannose-6-phosphate isomerase-like protein (cupin superfamily)
MKQQMLGTVTALAAVVAYGAITGAQAPGQAPVPPPAVKIQAGDAPNYAFDITKAEIDYVLKNAPANPPDRQLRVVDMGKYNLGVAVVHRGAMGGRGAGAGGGNAAAPSNPQPACGEQSAGATGPSGLYHDDTAESYIITSGSATMITGGKIVNGRRSAPDSEVTTILNGPSCSGTIVGGTTHEVKPGDIVIVPEGVPHGFTAIPDHVTYLSIRPDLKKVLQQGYVNPGLKK